MRILILSDFLPDSQLVLSPELVEMLSDADRIVFNLEGSPLLPEIEKNIDNQIMAFDVDKVIQFMESYGTDKFCIALANNHILDNGTIGFDFLIKKLKQHKIRYFGTKDRPHAFLGDVGLLNFVSAETVANRKLGKKRLNYLFYNTKKINSQIKTLEKKSNKLILYPHWGRDMDTQVFKTYEKKIDMSKKWLVFGHHTHVITGIDKDRIYSMGNNYIPHPYYFDRYPASRYGLAAFLNTETMNYELNLTSLVKTKESIVLNVEKFTGLDDEVISHGRDFGLFKRLFLKLFEFRGNPFDWLKLTLLQWIAALLLFRYKILKKGKSK